MRHTGGAVRGGRSEAARCGAQGTLPPVTAAAMADLCSLFCLRVIDSQMGDFLEDGYLSGRQVARRRPHTPTLVFGHSPCAGTDGCCTPSAAALELRADPSETTEMT